MKREPKDYIIFPLDLPNRDEAMRYVQRLSNHVGLFKVGLELFISEGPDILKAIRDSGPAQIFLDLKLHDIPATVQKAFEAARRHGVRFVTVHCDAGSSALRAAAGKQTPETGVLAVTVLTSMDGRSLEEVGYDIKYAQDIPRLVFTRARIAREAGCQGIVCSGRELEFVREAMGRDLVFVVPGIRPSWSLIDGDDQRRVVTPEKAVKMGADYLVIGRPIRDARDPAEAAQRVEEEIARGLSAPVC